MAVSDSVAAPAGGTIEIWGKPSLNGGVNGGSTLITGAIGDHGTSFAATASGKVSKKGTYKLLVLTKGSILVNTTQLNNAANNAFNNLSVNTTTCSGSISVTQPVPIVSGTKLYSGITGSTNITLTIAFVIPLQKGKCNTGNNGPNPSGSYGSVTGSGSVSF